MGKALHIRSYVFFTVDLNVRVKNSQMPKDYILNKVMWVNARG